MLRNTFSGWKLDTPKPIEELQVDNRSYIIHLHLKYYCKQISCIQNTHCDYEVGVDPIPAIEDSVEFSLYLNFLGEPQTMSGPMEVGESISVECKEPGNYNQIIIIIEQITT